MTVIGGITKNNLLKKTVPLSGTVYFCVSLLEQEVRPECFRVGFDQQANTVDHTRST